MKYIVRPKFQVFIFNSICSSIGLNGYLFNDFKIKELKALKLKEVQITLDGKEHTHNTRRRLKGRKEGSYNKIVNNIFALIDNDIFVKLRINIDKTNYNEVNSVIDIFSTLPYKNKIQFSLGHLFDSEFVCKKTADNFFTSEEYSHLYFCFNKNLQEREFRMHMNMFYPYLKYNHCCANNLNTYLIDSGGYLYKCFEEIGNKKKSVGNLLGDNVLTEIYSRSSKYLLVSPFNNSTCLECEILPICMGGCPIHNTGHSCKCDVIKYILDDILLDKYSDEILQH